MYEQQTARQQRLAYEKILYRYSTALEQGDFDTIIALLKMAENDSYLEQLLIETHNEGYQQEERSMQQNDIDTPVTQPAPMPAPAMPKRARKPRKRWIVALERTVAVLVAAALIASALVLFSTHNKQQVRVKSTPTTQTGASSDGIVVTVSMQSFTASTLDLAARNARTGALLWQNSSLGSAGVNSSYGLAIAGQTVYVAYDKHVLAFQLKNGKQLWSQPLGKDDSFAIIGDAMPQLIVDQGIVYASGYSDGNLYALNAQTGAILWTYDAPIPALLTVSNGIAYVLASDNGDQNAVKALQGTNGDVLWHYDMALPLSATVADNVLYVQAVHGSAGDPTGANKEQKPLIAINATNGNKIWSVVAPANGPSPLVVAQGMVVLFDGNHFCGYHTSNGSYAWCTTGPENDINGSGLFSVDGIVYGVYNPSFTEGLVEAINPQNGQMEWTKPGAFEASNNPQLLAQGDSLILPTGGIVLNRTNGHVLWQLSGSVLAAAVSG